MDRDAFMEATKPVYKIFAPIVGQDNIDKVEALKE